jgi:hypothetical protein
LKFEIILFGALKISFKFNWSLKKFSINILKEFEKKVVSFPNLSFSENSHILFISRFSIFTSELSIDNIFKYSISSFIAVLSVSFNFPDAIPLSKTRLYILNKAMMDSHLII